MPGEPFDREQIDRFILDEIDSVPQLEALLLIWNSRPKEWSVEDIARALYVSNDGAQAILKDLASRRLIVEVSGNRGQYTLLAESPEKSAMLAALDRTYRRELVRISTMIHSKASRAVRDFARAFRFTKD
jgi:DNA-binding MarR family transcriptional regulator